MLPFTIGLVISENNIRRRLLSCPSRVVVMNHLRAFRSSATSLQRTSRRWTLLSGQSQCRTASVLGSPEVHQQWSAEPWTHVVDLRTDALSRPTVKMRHAMHEADIGNNVLEDPTAKRLQEKCADILQKEAALFVPSCTMANTIAVMIHCMGHFNQFLVGSDAYMSTYNLGPLATFSGALGQTVPNQKDGTIDLNELRSKLNPPDHPQHPWTKLICLENTHSKCGGRVLPLDYIRAVRSMADHYSVQMHLDGARLFNAATTSGVPASQIATHFDTVAVSLNKGLCCPIGALLLGSQELIDKARKLRKALGGGMGQLGVVAAPALVALESQTKCLWKDHDRARGIAEGIRVMGDNPVCSVDLDNVETNIVMLDMTGSVSPAAFVARMAEVPNYERNYLGASVQVLTVPFSHNTVRCVTHHNVTDEHVELMIKKMRFVIDELSKPLADAKLEFDEATSQRQKI